MNDIASITHQSYNNEVITLKLKLGLTTRLIGSAMLGFFAIFFGYYFVSGIIEYIRFATLEEWFQNSLGFLFNLALVLLFAIPSWLILFGRNWVTIDKQEGIITAVRDWRIFRQTAQHDLVDAQAILVITQISSHKDSSATVSYMVNLLLKKNKTVLLSLPDDEETAENEASQMATYLNLPIEHRTVRS